MAQNAIRVGNNIGRGRVETGERRLIPIPISQSQHREVQARESVGVNFLLVRMILEPPLVKCRCAAHSFNRLKHFGRVNRRRLRTIRRRRGWGRWRAISAVVEVGHGEGIIGRTKNKFIDVQTVFAAANLKRLRQVPRAHSESILPRELREIDPFPHPTAERATASHNICAVVKTSGAQTIHKDPIGILRR